jgi:hypothetical protein
MTAPETPEPTLDDLLAACDLAEEAGVPPAVVAELRSMVRIGVNLRMRDPGLAKVYAEIQPPAHPPVSLKEMCESVARSRRSREDPTHPYDQIRLADNTEDFRWEHIPRRQ